MRTPAIPRLKHNLQLNFETQFPTDKFTHAWIVQVVGTPKVTKIHREFLLYFSNLLLLKKYLFQNYAWSVRRVRKFVCKFKITIKNRYCSSIYIWAAMLEVQRRNPTDLFGTLYTNEEISISHQIPFLTMTLSSDGIVSCWREKTKNTQVGHTTPTSMIEVTVVSIHSSMMSIQPLTRLVEQVNSKPILKLFTY